ncbi:MAG: branched-chain amino acid ABC transporter substrate-binding protein [Proteobacteria bacterium]|nr:branched-chain amino acid ABC transporter substrate-binding protein [Pseudomonadota bacterium]MBU1611568.1 branched-chain amino acid ABC transporter substrate-binding protein [Pseudomonadota bacterium]
MKRFTLFALLGALLLALLVAGCGGGEEAAEKAPEAQAEPVLKLGSMSPLTGPYSADGNDIANGAKAAIDVIKAEGGIEGFSDIVIFPEDTACDPKQAVASANKLISEGVVGVVGAYCSSSTIPSSETFDPEKILMVTPASTNPTVTERGLKYMFRMCGRDDHQAPSAVKFMSDFLKAKTIFIVDDKTTYSEGLANEVAMHCEKNGIEILARDHVNQGDKDFSAVLTKVKAMNPDVFYISLQNSATGALMLIQAARMGIASAAMGQDAVYHPQLMEIAKEAAEGAYLTFGFTDKGTETYKQFEAANAQYGQVGAYSAYAYDSAMALLKAVKAAGSTDPDAVRAAMLKLEFAGASKDVKFQENGDSGSNYIVYKVVDGAFVPFWNPATGAEM